MTRTKKLALAAMVFAGAMAAGTAAQARDVQWSVTLATPHIGPIPLPPLPVIVPRVVHTQPVVVPVVRGGYGYGGYGYGDRDRDGIPNRVDRRYNPRWDRDGDGVPNRYDRHDGGRDDWRGGRGHDRGHGRDDDRGPRR